MGLEERIKSEWPPKPKVLAAIIAVVVLYGLGAVGFDLATVIQNLEEELGTDLPDTKTLTAGLVAVVAAYMKKDNTV